MNRYEVKYDDSKIIFFIERKKVKNVNLTIRNTGKIIVTANDNVPLQFILDFVEKKADWIVKQIKQFKMYENENTIEKKLISGENIKYLGKQYRLKVIEDSDEGVKYFRGYIFLYIQDKDNLKNKQVLINKWMNYKCNAIFKECYEKIYAKVKKYDIPEMKIHIRKMKLRWGSCIADKKLIILNKNLITAPKYCIEYVILHELTHMVYRDHNNDFYNFLYMIMPDWKECKRILDEEIILDL